VISFPIPCQPFSKRRSCRSDPSTLTDAMVDCVSTELLSHFEYSNVVLVSCFDIRASNFPVPWAKGDGRGMRVLE
jgi:hypothetical protein